EPLAGGGLGYSRRADPWRRAFLATSEDAAALRALLARGPGEAVVGPDEARAWALAFFAFGSQDARATPAARKVAIWARRLAGSQRRTSWRRTSACSRIEPSSKTTRASAAVRA